MKPLHTLLLLVALLFSLSLIGACSITTHSAVSEAEPTPTPTPTVVAATPSVAPSKDELIPRISPNEALRQINAKEAVLIDVRDSGSFDLMHIKGAVNVSLQDIINNKFAALPKNKNLIFYCTCIREHSAALAAVELKEKGYEKVWALRDGLLGYKEAGGEIFMKN